MYEEWNSIEIKLACTLSFQEAYKKYSVMFRNNEIPLPKIWIPETFHPIYGVNILYKNKIV